MAKPHPKDTFKKWSQLNGVQRFTSVRAWPEANKAVIDIGYLEKNVMKSHTEVYVDLIAFTTYLRAIENNTAAELYKDEKFSSYGGAERDGKVISRVFVCEYWDKDSKQAFRLKTGHLVGQKTATGAYMPKSPNEILSSDSMKLTRTDLHEISYRLQLAIDAYVNQTGMLPGQADDTRGENRT